MPPAAERSETPAPRGSSPAHPAPIAHPRAGRDQETPRPDPTRPHPLESRRPLAPPPPRYPNRGATPRPGSTEVPAAVHSATARVRVDPGLPRPLCISLPPSRRRRAGNEAVARRAEAWRGRGYRRFTQPPPPPRRFTHPPPPPPARFTQPPPATRLTHPPAPPPFTHVPRPFTQPPRRFTHAPADVESPAPSHATPPMAAAMLAPDHFPMLFRNTRRSSAPCSSGTDSEGFGSVFIMQGVVISRLWFPAWRRWRSASRR